MTKTEKLADLAKLVSLKTRKGASVPWEAQDEWQQTATGYRCTLRYMGRSYTFDFWQGSAHTEPPDAAGCLECLLSDASSGAEDFESFCGEFGYDTDSRKAHKTWKACRRVSLRMRKLLGDDYERFLYADR